MKYFLRESTCYGLTLSMLVLVLSTPTAIGLQRQNSAHTTKSAQSDKSSGKIEQGAKDAIHLVPGNLLKGELAAGQAHSYKLTLAARHYVSVTIDPQYFDVTVTLSNPNGEILAKVSSLRGSQAPELISLTPLRISLITEETGDYGLDVRSQQKDESTGYYEVKIQEAHSATAQDRSRVAAEQAYSEGEQLRVEATAASLARSIEKFKQTLPLWQALGDRGGEAQTLRSIGLVHSLVGDKHRALSFYNQALSLMSAEGDRRAEAYLLIEVGWCYYVLGERLKALELYNQALPLMRYVKDRAGEATTLNRIGMVYTALGKTHGAYKLHHQALSFMRAIGYRTGEAYTLAHIGWIHHFLGDNKKALDHQFQALLLIEDTGDHSGEAYVLTNIGAMYHYLGDTQEALNYYNRALTVCRSLGYCPQEYIPLYKMARTHSDRGSLTEARTYIEAALGIIESQRTRIDSEELRASYFGALQEYFEFYIGLLMRLHKQHPYGGFDVAAMEASERARARTLIELLVEANVDLRRDTDPLLIERERSLQRLINARAESHKRILDSDPMPQRASELAEEITELTTQYQEVRAQIRALSPRYAALAQPQPLTLKEIQKSVLDPDTLLLEYSLGDEHSYLWAVTQDSILTYELPKRAEIEAAARRVYELLTARQPVEGETGNERVKRIAKADAQYQPAALALSRMLLGPVMSQLETRRLLIVADGALQYLPFAMLPVSNMVKDTSSQHLREDLTRSKDIVPLMFGHEIVSLPSASALAVLRRETAGRKCAGKAIVVLADPVFDKNDPRVKLRQNPKEGVAGAKPGASDLEKSERDVALVDSRGNLSRLPFSREEAEVILALAPAGQGLKAIDFKASRATAESPEMSQYCIVHIATHGLLNSKHPELSGIVLSLVDEQGRAQDGFLRLHEIYNLNLPAELVVLSACQTALGKEVKGEGLVGLTRGLMYAGAKRVMASLWKVNDSATAELMKHFYRGIFTKGLKPTAALREAQIEMWKKRQWESPYYWAAFVLQGEYR